MATNMYENTSFELINSAKQKLSAGSIALGVALRQTRTVDIVRTMKTAGADWLFIDLEHSSIDVDTAAQICTASLDARLATMVRVPEDNYGMAIRLLGAGALGVLMPNIKTVAQAREMVRQFRYPPVGNRGIAGRLIQYVDPVEDVGAALQAIDRATLLVATLESSEGIANVEAIAAVEGIDCIMIGTNDLALDMGIPGQVGHPQIAAAYDTVRAACSRHCKWFGMGGVTKAELLEKYVRLGARMVIAGGDVDLLIAGARERLRGIRNIAV